MFVNMIRQLHKALVSSPITRKPDVRVESFCFIMRSAGEGTLEIREPSMWLIHVFNGLRVTCACIQKYRLSRISLILKNKRSFHFSKLVCQKLDKILTFED